MSNPQQNPPPDLQPEVLPPLSAPLPPRRGEDPPWSGWQVLQIAVLTLASIMAFLLLTTYVAQRLLYPQEEITDVAKYPLVTVVAQVAAYFVVFAFMYSVPRRIAGFSFGEAIHWHWPRNWSGYLLGGIALALGLQGVAHFLPMPKELPIDRFFQTSAEAWVLSLFGVTLAPLFEELFFRGFLYPVLARRFGAAVSIAVTAACFGLIHAPQLGRAWGPVLVVFLVGVALTVTRAITRSVAAGFLMHVAYNGAISILIFAATGGFRHLEKLNQ